jgi:hypothetical protein
MDATGSRSHGSVPRCAAVWAGVTGAAAGVLAAVLPLLGSAYVGVTGPGLGAQPFDRVLVWACAVLAVVAGGWLWVVTTAAIVEALSGGDHPLPGVPGPVRRLVLTACGAAVVAGLAAPAYATPGEVHQDRHAAVSVAGLPLPDRAVAALPGAARVSDGLLVRPVPPTSVVEVRPGDTLWDLARRDLGPDADDAAITARWHEIYELNRSAIGADPDLIQPAQRLRLPTG